MDVRRVLVSLIVLLSTASPASASCPPGQTCGRWQFSDGRVLAEPAWKLTELTYFDARRIPLISGDGGWFFWDGCAGGGTIGRGGAAARWKHHPDAGCGASDFASTPLGWDDPTATELIAIVDVKGYFATGDELDVFFGFGELLEAFTQWTSQPFGLSNYQGLIRRGTTVNSIVGKAQAQKGWDNATYLKAVGSVSGQGSATFAIHLDLVTKTTSYYVDGNLVDTTTGDALWPAYSSRRVFFSCSAPTSEGPCLVLKYVLGHR